MIRFCQSCGIPIQESEGLFGTNADGSKMKTIASIALKTGFTADITMNEMIEFCVPHMVKNNKDMTEEKTRQMMQEYFPKLKRWKSV